MKNIDKSNISLRVAYIFESILAMVVLIAVFLGTIDVLRMIWTAYIVEYHTPVAYSQLNDILAQIARKMLLLPKSGGMLEVLICVIAIAGLFTIRKYLLTKDNSNMNITSIHYDRDDDIIDAKDPI